MNRASNTPDDQDWLDKMLAGPDDYIHDDGFTESVMNRLPARRQLSRVRALIFGCAALLSLVLLLLSTPDLAALYAACLGFLQTQPLYNLAALAITLYAATSALAWWLIDPDL